MILPIVHVSEINRKLQRICNKLLIKQERINKCLGPEVIQPIQTISASNWYKLKGHDAVLLIDGHPIWSILHANARNPTKNNHIQSH